MSNSKRISTIEKDSAMKTITFIGSDKNAGKTTAMNFMYQSIRLTEPEGQHVCLTSTGINGEESDFFDGKDKPHIVIHSGDSFITAAIHLKDLNTAFQELERVTLPSGNRLYVFGRALSDCRFLLEGPNTRADTLLVKKVVKKRFSDAILMIDGSVDRQFVGDPEISDLFYFSLLLSSRKDQIEKAKNLLLPLTLNVLPLKEREWVEEIREDDSSLFLDNTMQVVYRGIGTPFLDTELLDICDAYAQRGGTLYLRGALTSSLYATLSRHEKLTVVLDNFTLYLAAANRDEHVKHFFPALFLLNPIPIAGVFIRLDERGGFHNDSIEAVTQMIPSDVPVYDLAKDRPESIKLLFS